MRDKNKIRYQCIGCGTCCRWSGHVRLLENEVDAIANFLELTVADFIKKHRIF